MLKLITLLLFTSLTISAVAQNHWENLLSNNREESLTQIEKELNKSQTLENIVARELIWRENGNVLPTRNFINQFSSKADYPYYLYALWNEEFLFGDYLSVGFNKRKRENINAFYAKEYSDITVESAVDYLKAIVDRNYNDFESFKRNSLKIGAIRNWQFCGVFENLNGSGLDVVYDPETHPTNDIVFEANSNGKVNWYTPNNNKYEAYPFFGGHEEYGTGVHYAQTFFKNTKARKAVLRLGGSDRIKVWLNDVVVFETNKSATTDLDAYLVELNLPEGNNRLLVKLSGQSRSNYIFARITDLKGDIIEDIKYESEYLEYNKSSLSDINPIIRKTNFEEYFETKHKIAPKNFLYAYCLIRTYLRNERHEKAKEILVPLLEEYPKSSILRGIMIQINLLEEDYNSSNEMKENIQKDDENYHISMTYRFADVGELFRLSAVEMESFLDSYAEMMNDDIITNTCKFIMSLRRENKTEIKKYLEKLIKISTEREQLKSLKVYAPIYSSVFKDTKSHLKLLNELNKKYFDMEVRNQLSGYYSSIEKQSKSYAILQENYKLLGNEFKAIKDIVDYLQSFERYNESMPFIEEMYKIYPYSFQTMKAKGNSLLQMNKTDEALKLFNQSLIYNSADLTLRRKTEDLSGREDVIEQYVEKDIYDYIAKSKGQIKKNNYGFNIIKNNAIVELFPEAGGRGRYTIIFEITSEKGIERLKEYDLGLYGNYDIIKSEIIKEDGSLVPADASGSSFVFTNLAVGDVILVDYQSGFSNSGRFYKDHVDYFTFDGFHPTQEASFILIAPKDKKINHIVTHDEVDFTTEVVKDNKLYKWSMKNHPGCGKSESYMPELVDFASVLHISTIKDWNEIANWYSDLVRSQMIINADVKREFKVVFPEEDPTQLSETERAERIYKYMMNNFNYSSVNFRQSGFIPQKPSKTLNTKLGDCKDFSTVYATFAEMAGLEANIVLVLTSNNGRDDIILPSQDFNHCIVRVMLNGEEQFLELTNKNLPFRALPNSVRAGTVLVIPKKPSPDKKFNLRHLSEPNRIQNKVKKKVKMYVTKENQRFEISSELEGYSRSYWTGVFETPTYENYESEVSDFFQDRINPNSKLDTVYPVSVSRGNEKFIYNVELSLSEKLNKIGAFNILKIPHIHNEYNGEIISEDKRKHTIEYSKYEEADLYSIDYDVYLEEGKFSEIPENKSFEFKDHAYTRTYELIGPQHLVIKVHSTMSIENITVDEYPEFKEFVKKVLDAKDEFIGFE